MTLSALILLVLALAAAWQLVFNREGFAKLLVEDRPIALSLAALLWLFAVNNAGLSPGVALLLKLPSVAIYLYTVWWAVKTGWITLEVTTEPKPRMSAHELISLAEDIAKADRLRASTDRLDHVRAKALIDSAIAQAARDA